MSKYDLTNRTSDIDILQKNMRELQGQLADAHKRILELTSDRNSTLEELEEAAIKLTKHSRLGCQDKLKKEYNNITVTIAPE